MGQEARCACTWNRTTIEVQAQIEPPHLILRGGLRKRIRIATIRRIEADGPMLRFHTEEDGQFALGLGAAKAGRWAEALRTPPPSLAKKLGITAQTRVRTIGPVDDPELARALEEARKMPVGGCDLIVARVDAPSDLALALEQAAADLARGVPIWLVYRKGRGHALGESTVRSAGLAAGVVDTKVAAVSAVLTGLRFQRRKA